MNPRSVGRRRTARRPPTRQAPGSRPAQPRYCAISGPLAPDSHARATDAEAAADQPR
jgi:hypothetical protein